MEIEIRDFESTDIDFSYELYVREKESFEEFGLTRDFMLECCFRPDYLFLVAYADRKFAGICGCLLYSSVGRAEFGPIVVDKEITGKGVGTKLLERMHEKLKKRQIKRVCAKVKVENMCGRKFFFKNGYILETYRHNYTSSGGDALEFTGFIL